MALKAFKTPAAASETEFVVNKSRFIGRAFPVETEAEALEILERIRQKHYDATHNCWAYNLRGASPLRRFSDDGEPGGTAGMPIMDTLIRSETENALIIVTRYFGGILLGSGGLVRAYSRSAADALSAAGSVTMTPCAEIEFVTDYTRFGGIEGFVRKNSTVRNIEFLENIKFNCLVETKKADGLPLSGLRWASHIANRSGTANIVSVRLRACRHNFIILKERNRYETAFFQ